jgi:hypothetical protein
VPVLDIERAQLLQELGTEMRSDLVFDQLAISIRGPGRDLSSLNEGAKVSFEETENRGKTSAENLRVS